MEEINAIAHRHGLAVIEDAAQSFGATYHGKQSCNLSTIGCTSFFPSKPLGCYGDGGALFTSDDALAAAMREIRVHGQSRRYVHTRVGVGGRMDTLQCAIVLAKLERFEFELGQRQLAADSYDALLSGRVQLVGRQRDRTSVFAQYTVVLEERERVQAALHAAGIPTAVHYPVPMHRQPAYAHLSSPESCPVASAMAARVMSLPMGPYLAPDSAHEVAEAVLLAAGVALPAELTTAL
jgi:UDP-2-acetamido-2-deoxy-ribo-hexuluronate aminotransferase